MAHAELNEGRTGIDIENVGPNVKVHVPLPEEGGVVVLRGRNDIGKSEAIKAIGALSGRKEQLSVYSDAPLGTKGTVTGGGVSLTVARSTRRRGEAEFSVLEGRLSLADLVAPGVKSDDAADARRIKALVSLAGGTISLEQLYEVAGGKEAFDAMLTAEDIDDDPVVMAGRLKRAIEAKARHEEDQIERCKNEAKALRDSVADVDVSRESDSLALQQQLESAIAENSRLKEQRESARQRAESAAEARDKLAKAEAEWPEEKRKAVGDELDLARQIAADCENAVSELRTQLEEAEKKLYDAERDFERAASLNNKLQQHIALTSQWQETIESSAGAPAPTDEQLTEADSRVAAAREAVEEGVKVRNAKQQIAKAEQLESEIVTHERSAALLRDSAKSTDDLLSDIVGTLGCPLRVRGGRLVIPAGEGKEKFFGDISAGARWKIALDVGIDAVGPGGLLPIPQEAWEGLDPINQRLIAEHVEGKRVCIIAAECSEDPEISAEVFVPGSSEA